MRPATRRLLLVTLFLAIAVAGPALLAGVALGLPAMGSVAAVLGTGAAIGLLMWLGWRLLRLFLFRVGRKLAFSYFLIGVLPVPMLVALLALCAYLLCGFFLGHVYRDTVDNLHRELEAAAEVRLARLTDGRAPQTAPHGVSLAVYRNGRLTTADPGFPRLWPGWLDPAEGGDRPHAVYVALADGTPTLAATVSGGEYGVLALFSGGIEAEISRRSRVWVRLYRPDDPERPSRFRLQMFGKTFSLQPMAKESLGGAGAFFGPEASDGPTLDRPLIWWGEISGPLHVLADGTQLSEFVTVTLNGTLRTVARNLLSASAEVDTFAWGSLIGVAGLLGTMYAIALAMALVIIFTLSRAVNRLSRATAAVQRGDFSARIPVRRKDQIGELQRSFNEMTENLEMLVAAAAQKESLEKELAIARDLQRSLLPRRLPSSERLEFSAMFEPSAAIGGDYYDILPISPGKVAVVVADVAGHGLPAGLRMAMLKAALLMLVEEGKPPEQIVQRLNGMVNASAEKRFFVTAVVAMVDIERGVMEITNAGHPPIYLKRGSKVREILLPGNPLGALGESYGRESVPLEPDDLVVWLSDGLLEATDGDGEPFGYERVRESLAGDASSAAEIRDRLIAAVNQHAGGKRAEDDKTVVVMRYRAAATAATSSPSVS